MILFLFCFSAPLSAHNLVDRNVQGIGSVTELVIGPTEVTVDCWVQIGDIEAVNVRRDIDRNGDGRLAPQEKSSYFDLIEKRIRDGGFVLEIDRQIIPVVPSTFTVDYGKAPDSVGTEPILYNVQAKLPLPDGAEGDHACSFYVTNTINRPVLLKLFVREEGGVRIAPAAGQELAARIVGLDGKKCGMTENASLLLRFGTGVLSAHLPPAPVGGGVATATDAGGIDARAKEEMNSLVKRVKSGEWSLQLVLFSILLSMFFGAAHALSPGHGKTLVAAYLVGSSGRKRDAVTLGLTVTATHTSSVILACLFIIWLQSRYPIDQGDVAVWLGIISGVIIVAIGLWLLVWRIRVLATGVEPEHGHTHGPLGMHVHGPGEEGHAHGPAGELIPAAVALKAVAAEGEVVPELAPVEVASVPPPMWSLISLGISGGIVPCPTAIVVLALSISLGVPKFGLLLILAFGSGLAAVLVAIGLLLVTGRARMGTSPRYEWIVKRLPLVSAVLVTVIGVAMTTKALREGKYIGGAGAAASVSGR